MAYNTKPIITDVDGNPISQYYNKELDHFEPVEGQAGANKVVLYNTDGTENNQLSLIPILEKLSQLTGTIIDEETRKSNELERIDNEDTRQSNEDIRNTNEIARVEDEDIRIQNENTRIQDENIRQTNEQNRIELYNDLMNKVAKGYFNGKNLEFNWDGTSLGVRVEGETEYIYVDLKGETGDIENLTMRHVINALGYTPIKSVNNVVADEVGNVELDIDTSVIENRIGNVEDDLETHKAEKATQDGYGHIRLQDIPNPEVATQAEAEIGTNNTKMMTPLRVAQSIDSKIIVVDNMLKLNINGEWQIFKLVPPEDTTNAPGSKFLLGGTMDAGYFGEVSMNELITGDSLASKIGLSAGTSQFSDTAGWLKFAYKGKIQFVAKKPLRHSLSWDSINSANAVYGDKTVVIDGLTYKIRLMRGANKDPADAYNGSVNHGSEWNRLMLPIHIQAKDKSWAYPNSVENDIPYWGIDFTDEDLLTHYNYGNGSYSWCQEVAESTSSRIYRGGNGVSYSGSHSSSFSTSSRGWRPCLELVS